MKPKSILFVYSQWQTFVREDFDLLTDAFHVKKLRFRLEKSFFNFFVFQIIGFFKLLINIPLHDVVYIWFCDYHAFWAVWLAQIFRKKTVIVVGGFDAVKIPDISYGLFTDDGLRQKLAKFAYRNCDKIVAVDASLIKGKNTYAGKNSVSGVAHFVNNIEEKSVVIPTGYDHDKWHSSHKKHQVLTVALIKDSKVFYRKGIDIYLEIAKFFPEIPFYLIGLHNKSIIPFHLQNLKNVHLKPIVPQQDLIDLYAETQVYCQFSLSEGLPNVLCEAMMSGCIPVGSSANGIPLAIGDCGYILEEKDVLKAVELVQKALNADEQKNTCARKRIQQLFPKNARKKALKKLIEKL